MERKTGVAICDAVVSAALDPYGAPARARSGVDGRFFLSSLTPGTYYVWVEKPGFQRQDVGDVELSVATRIDLRFSLRDANDVWGTDTNRYVSSAQDRAVAFYAADARELKAARVEAAESVKELLHSGISSVIDRQQLRSLPLAGRDVFTLLVAQPGVTSDAPVARGLGMAVNGQRSTATNYLVDGVETNDYLLSGPLLAIAPESVQEYRLSTSNFSAEFGRGAGVIANAITRTSGATWHGEAYAYGKNRMLNANEFQRNVAGEVRREMNEWQAGAVLAGPIAADRIFATGSFERLRSRSVADSEAYYLPTSEFLQSISGQTNGSRLLRQYPSWRVSGPADVSGPIRIAAPVSLDRSLSVARIEKRWTGRPHQIMGRMLLGRLSRPDFSWTPYPDFVSGLNQDATGLAVSSTIGLASAVVLDARFGWSFDNAGYDRAHSEIPTLTISRRPNAELPGSPLPWSYRNRSRNLEPLVNLNWVKGRRILKLGGGLLDRRLSGYWTAGNGSAVFSNLQDFVSDRVTTFRTGIHRHAEDPLVPDTDRTYRYRQGFFYLQESLRVTARFVLNYGVRYENFGSPRNISGNPDTVLSYGSGDSLGAKLTGAYLRRADRSERVFTGDNNDWAPRLGLAWRPRARGGAVVRAGYGVFYDRPFDNLWQTLRHNNVVEAEWHPVTPTRYLAPLQQVIQSLGPPAIRGAAYFRNVTSFQPGLRTPYVSSHFGALTVPVREGLTVEISGGGSAGRKLLATDIVNRTPTVIPRLMSNVSYRSNQGGSSYRALAAALRWRNRHSQLHAVYTWSNSVDNQSDALQGEFSDLAVAGGSVTATFSKQYDSRIDRGNSDFDQRHNLVIASVAAVPGSRSPGVLAWLSRDWQLAGLAGIRSGTPFSVIAKRTAATVLSELIFNNRADLVKPDGVYVSGEQTHSVPGGRLLLNKDAFRDPGPSTLGSLKRNPFYGPGLVSIDLSVSRALRLPWPGERGRLLLRADAFNAVNHTNLNNPTSLLEDRLGFGQALFGRVGRSAGMPTSVPFREMPRQIQLLLRIEF